MKDNNDNLLNAELVITLPDPYGHQLAYKKRLRMTIGVLVQIISQAKHLIVISAPYINKDQLSGCAPISQAITSALERDVKVMIISTEHSIER